MVEQVMASTAATTSPQSGLIVDKTPELCHPRPRQDHYLLQATQVGSFFACTFFLQLNVLAAVRGYPSKRPAFDHNWGGMALSQSIEKWLLDVILPQYLHKQVTYSHVHHFLLAHLKQGLNFRVRTAVHTSAQGHPQLLVNIYGTITVDEEIGVPLSIWVPLEYPLTAQGVPIVYVLADHTRNWFLRPTNNVDTTGMFYHPYLTDWAKQAASVQKVDSNYNLNQLIDVVATTVLKRVPIFIGALSLPPRPPPQLPQSDELASAKSSLPARYASPLPRPENTNESETATHGISTRYASPLPRPESIDRALNRLSARYACPLPLPPQVTGDDVTHTSPTQLHRPQPPPPAPPFDATSLTKNLSLFISPDGLPGDVPDPAAVADHASHKPALMTTREAPTASDIMDADSASPEPESKTQPLAMKVLFTHVNAQLKEMPVAATQKQASIHQSRSLALRTQLTHHYCQAQANSDNLAKISDYLAAQIAAATNLNKRLTMLVSHNIASAEGPWTVTTDKGQKLELDDLIIADSPLSKQLYDVVLEIKACKDALGLISGSFKNPAHQLTTDESLRTCAKQARSLGRDIFWLELTKKEILKRLRQD